MNKEFGSEVITRRDFLKRMAVITGLLVAPAFTREGIVSEDPALLKQEIEETYRVNLIDSSDNIGVAEIVLYSGEVVEDWDLLQLQILEDTLKKLPDTFYKPRQLEPQKKSYRINDHEPLPIKIGLVSDAYKPYMVGWLIGDTNPYNDIDEVALFGKTDLVDRGYGRMYSEIMIVHELAHYATVPRIGELTASVIKPLGINSESDLPQLINNGISFEEIENYASLTWDELRKINATINFREFLAVASEYYFRGPSKFRSIYTPIFGQDSTADFYTNMKVEIFEGKEY